MGYQKARFARARRLRLRGKPNKDILCALGAEVARRLEPVNSLADISRAFGMKGRQYACHEVNYILGKVVFELRKSMGIDPYA
jgi:hypothetical protein